MSTEFWMLFASRAVAGILSSATLPTAMAYIGDSTSEELKLQLGWKDMFASDNDLFDAWLETPDGNTQLLSGNMGTEIQVHSAGFELTGTESFVTGFRTAVPEPGTCCLIMMGLIGPLALRRGWA